MSSGGFPQDSVGAHDSARSKRSVGWILFALVLAGTVLLAGAAIGGYKLLAGSKPVQITLVTPPPSATEIWIDYKLIGEPPADQSFLVVAHAPDDFPFQRMLSAREVAAGGKIGLAVPKDNVFYRVSIRVSEKGKAVSNTLWVKF
jgi:hypothetical protein